MTISPSDTSMEHEEIRTEMDRVRARIDEINAERGTLSDQIDKLQELNKLNSTPEPFDAEFDAKDKRRKLLEELGQKHRELDLLKEKLDSLPPERPSQEKEAPEPEQPKAPETKPEKKFSRKRLPGFPRSQKVHG